MKGCTPRSHGGDGPYNIGWTHPEVVNKALLDFIAA